MNPTERLDLRKSRRVLLQAVVTIQTILPDGRLGRVQAFTSVVNAHGGLLQCTLKLVTDQRILLIKPNSGMELGCRVVRVEGPKSALYEIQFSLRPILDIYPNDLWLISAFWLLAGS